MTSSYTLLVVPQLMMLITPTHLPHANRNSHSRGHWRTPQKSKNTHG